MADDSGGRVPYAFILLPLLIAYGVALRLTWSRGLPVALLAILATTAISAAIFAALVGIHLFISQESVGVRTLQVLSWLAAALGLTLAIEVVCGIR